MVLVSLPGQCFLSQNQESVAPRSVQEVTKITNRPTTSAATTYRVPKLSSEDKCTQTKLIDWAQIESNVEYFPRICKTLCQLKTLKELCELGRSECPDLEPELIRGIAVFSFPKKRGLNEGESGGIQVFKEVRTPSKAPRGEAEDKAVDLE